MATQPFPLLFLGQTLEPVLFQPARRGQVTMGGEKLFDLLVRRMVEALAQRVQQQVGIQGVVAQARFQALKFCIIAPRQSALGLVILASLVAEAIGLRGQAGQHEQAA